MKDNSKSNKQSPAPTLAEQAGKLDEITHCPITQGKAGEKVKGHIQMENQRDSMYVASVFVGNPPQKVRALFDTGSTNTWVLNKKTSIEAGK